MLTIGLMSGTSLDGVDGVLAHFEDSASSLRVLAHAHAPMPEPLRAELLDLNRPGDNELHRSALAANALAELQAGVVARLLLESGTAAHSVAAVGSHGQTVRHRPGEFDGVGYTLQLNQPALLAERCGVAVVSDFRSRDVAAGGQGAPLVPAFHAQVFGAKAPRAVLNLGGIGNLTLLPEQGAIATVRGFDCGPGNALLDHWATQHLGRPFDEDGRWAATGQVHHGWLQQLMAEPFLAAPPPKSTGRDLFNPDWLGRMLQTAPGTMTPVDVQATLSEFTVEAASQALLRHAPSTKELLVCGGGALNGWLMQRLSARLPDWAVRSTSAVGLPPMQVEAAAFAWLTWAFLKGQPASLSAVTGAKGPRILGALYPA